MLFKIKGKSRHDYYHNKVLIFKNNVQFKLNYIDDKIYEAYKILEDGELEIVNSSLHLNDLQRMLNKSNPYYKIKEDV